MNLDAYFDQYPTAAIADIAKQAGTSLAYLRNCKYGHRRMSADLAIWLEYVTNGELTARELRTDLPWSGTTPAQFTPAASLPEAA